MRYFVRRVLLAIPTLLAITLITFGLSKCAPKDKDLEIEQEHHHESYQQQRRDIALKAARLGLDKPAFYCTISTAAMPDTLFKIFPVSRCERLTRLAAITGNWDAVDRFDKSIYVVWDNVRALPDSVAGVVRLRSDVSTLMSTNRPDTAVFLVKHIIATSGRIPELSASLDALQASRQALQVEKHPERNWIPVVRWYGFDNQYHHWLSGFIVGDMGLTRGAQKKVWDEIKPALMASFLVNVLGLLFAYLVGIPLGMAIARRKNTRTDRWMRRALLFLYAMPVFWLSGLMIIFFATPGMGLNLIPGVVIPPFQDSGKTLVEWFWVNKIKFILPVLSISLHIMAVLALQMRGSIIAVMGQDYIRTARAKGADENSVYWKHAYRNALFPIVTVFAGAFPVIFAGSLIVESMFYYPGMGTKTLAAFRDYDYPLLFALLVIASVFTIIGSLLADLLYAWLDPRVKYG